MPNKITAEELVALMDKYGDDLKVKRTVDLSEEGFWNSHSISYKGIVIGNEQSSKEQLESSIEEKVTKKEKNSFKEGFDKNDTYEILQLDFDNEKSHKYLFTGYDHLKIRGLSPKADLYDSVYKDILKKDETLDDLFEKFNLHHPEDFKGRSLSVGDVIILNQSDVKKVFMVDSYGFSELKREKEDFLNKFEKHGLDKLEDIDEEGGINGESYASYNKWLNNDYDENEGHEELITDTKLFTKKEFEAMSPVQKQKYFAPSWIGQGLGFKALVDWDKVKPNEIIYIPEGGYSSKQNDIQNLPVDVYTKKDFIDLCEGDKAKAHITFAIVDWQFPETFLEEAEWGDFEEDLKKENSGLKKLATCKDEVKPLENGGKNQEEVK